MLNFINAFYSFLLWVNNISFPTNGRGIVETKVRATSMAKMFKHQENELFKAAKIREWSLTKDFFEKFAFY